MKKNKKMRYKIIEEKMPNGKLAYSIRKPILWGLFYVHFFEPTFDLNRCAHSSQRFPRIMMNGYLYSSLSEARNVILDYKRFHEAKVQSKLGARIEKCHGGYYSPSISIHEDIYGTTYPCYSEGKDALERTIKSADEWIQKQQDKKYKKEIIVEI